jgi:hypothetical protein
MRQGSIENSMAKQSGSDRAPKRARGSLFFALSVAVCSVFAAANAHAEPEFPGVLKDKAGATCIVTCLTCHTDPAGGADKLKLPFGATFGAAVKAADGGSTMLLDTFNMSDTDMDGVKDLVEVKAGQDPTVFGPQSICTPSYGCGARLARPSRERGTVVALALAAGALVLAGRRRSKPRMK